MSETLFAIVIFAMTGLLYVAMKYEKYRAISIIAIVVIGFILIATSSGGFNFSSSRSMNHSCVRCGKATSMEIDGRYYCFDHYNDRLFGK